MDVPYTTMGFLDGGVIGSTLASAGKPNSIRSTMNSIRSAFLVTRNLRPRAAQSSVLPVPVGASYDGAAPPVVARPPNATTSVVPLGCNVVGVGTFPWWHSAHCTGPAWTVPGFTWPRCAPAGRPVAVTGGATLRFGSTQSGLEVGQVGSVDVFVDALVFDE